ncbi:unnamed protein product [Ectocarpus sp. CCAP 1310/34]|nr:unnamed protein product [Ectocarpus sp. CCAP 1310/34]
MATAAAAVGSTTTSTTEQGRRGTKRRRRSSRSSSSSSSSGVYGSLRLFVAGFLLLGGRRGDEGDWGGLLLAVTGQEYIDGGDVSMACDECDCRGSSDSGTIVVFENPATESLVAKVEGEYSEVVETSCGSSAILVGSTVYELSGVDFGGRSLGVADLSADDCAGDGVIPTAPSDADCYSGESPIDVEGSTGAELTFCHCKWNEGENVAKYATNVRASVKDYVDISVPDSGLVMCQDQGVFSQLVTVLADDSSFYYLFDLDVPGYESAEDLVVSSGPSSDAQALACSVDEEGDDDDDGEEEEEEEEEEVETPSPTTAVEEEPQTTPAPVTPEEAVEEVPVTTPAPSLQPDSSTAGQGATSSSTTAAPVEVDTPAPTPASRGLGTPAPSSAAVDAPPAPTQAPVAAAVPTLPPAPATAAPAAAAAATAAPAAAAAATLPPTPPAVTPGPTVVLYSETLAPLTEEELEQVACTWPLDGPCTTETLFSDINRGLGAYYDPGCSGAGCGVGDSGLCRTCYFNLTMGEEGNDDDVDMPDYPECPCCVMDEYDRSADRCVGATPSPAQGTGTEALETYSFEDKPLDMSGGEGFAVAALALFGLLTFLPLCTK